MDGPRVGNREANARGDFRVIMFILGLSLLVFSIVGFLSGSFFIAIAMAAMVQLAATIAALS
jgi:NhaP-type Na+/H+ and K+/H+ antiporter